MRVNTQVEDRVLAGCRVSRRDYRAYLKHLPNASVDLILTDPPYAISKRTGFKSTGEHSVDRLAVSMNFGTWDQKQIDIDALAQHAYTALRKGGTIIVWYDVWKVSTLADALQSAGFCMLRLIIWNKTNPVPLNSRSIYLSNSREMAVVGVKGGKPTFNAEYDNGLYDNELDLTYNEPIPRHNGKRIHKTQKPLSLFEDLVRKHSNEGDSICDPFLGSGTTAIAALRNGRQFVGCDIEQEYVDASIKRIKEEI